MFGFEFKGLSNQQKGALYIISGTILLLHTLGILEQWLNFFIIAGSIAMIIYGIFKANFIIKLLALVRKKPKSEE